MKFHAFPGFVPEPERGSGTKYQLFYDELIAGIRSVLSFQEGAAVQNDVFAFIRGCTAVTRSHKRADMKDFGGRAVGGGKRAFSEGDILGNRPFDIAFVLNPYPEHVKLAVFE
ncbi:hypothetical protein SDC9_183091 [bioreactor metagenome]|uniref:Uncharacterized protein n=1 Tax=bioreactor metagenome TaxID=1076179 RepID=A0A645HIV7_9ZZZZ